MVSIHGPLGYGPSTLPLRHSAWGGTSVLSVDISGNGYDAVIYYFTRMISVILFLVKLLKIKLRLRLTIISLPRLKTVFIYIGATLLITLVGGGGRSWVLGTLIYQEAKCWFLILCVFTPLK